MGVVIIFLAQTIKEQKNEISALELDNIANQQYSSPERQIPELKKHNQKIAENYQSFINKNTSDTDHDKRLKNLLNEGFNSIVLTNNAHAGKWFITDITLTNPNQAVVQHEDGHYEFTAVIQISDKDNEYEFTEIK